MPIFQSPLMLFFYGLRILKRSIPSVTKLTIQQYSIFRLWRGLTPVGSRRLPVFHEYLTFFVFQSLFRAVPGSALYFHSLNLFKEKIPYDPFFVLDFFLMVSFRLHRKVQQTLFMNGLCGALARAAADLVVFPFTLIKARLEVKPPSLILNLTSGIQSSRYTTMSMITVAQHIHATDGLKGSFLIACDFYGKRLILGFYIGLLPTLARDLPFSGIYYMSYRELKDAFLSDPRKRTLFRSSSLHAIKLRNLFQSNLVNLSSLDQCCCWSNRFVSYSASRCNQNLSTSCSKRVSKCFENHSSHS